MDYGMTMQQQYRDAAPFKAPRAYRSAGVNKQVMAIKFLFECTEKLAIKPLTVATAALYFHRFYAEVDTCEYDEYLIAAATIYLATKVKDEPVNIRDLVSVIHCTLNRTIEPPEKDREFWLIRDAIVQAELLVTRMLKFDLNSAVHPHKYLLHYMKFLADWFGPVWTTMPIAKTAAGFLQDFYHSPEILNFKPTHVAICCLSLALQIYGLQVPVRFDADPEQWYSAFVDDDLSKEKHWAICEKILAVYDHQDMGLPANQSMMRQGHEYQKQLTD